MTWKIDVKAHKGLLTFAVVIATIAVTFLSPYAKHFRSYWKDQGTSHVLVLSGNIEAHESVKGVGLDVLWPQMLGMASLGISLFTVAVLRLHKSLD